MVQARACGSDVVAVMGYVRLCRNFIDELLCFFLASVGADVGSIVGLQEWFDVLLLTGKRHGRKRPCRLRKRVVLQ